MSPAELTELRRLVHAEREETRVVAHDAQGEPVTAREFRELMFAEFTRRTTGLPLNEALRRVKGRGNLSPRRRSRGASMTNRERARRTRWRCSK